MRCEVEFENGFVICRTKLFSRITFESHLLKVFGYYLILRETVANVWDCDLCVRKDKSYDRE